MKLEKAIEQFLTWLKEREQVTKEEFKEKGWTVKAEVTVIKEKFEEIFEIKKMG